MPTKNKYSRKLISADKKANTAEYKHNYMIDIAPLCKDDLVLLPKELAAKQSNISPVVLVKRVAASIFVIDPHTGEVSAVFQPNSAFIPYLIPLLFLFVSLFIFLLENGYQQ